VYVKLKKGDIPMLVNKAATYSASATDALKPTADETTQKKEKSEVAGDLYTFEQFYDIVHSQRAQSSVAPLQDRLISHKVVRPRAHSVELSSQD
jgi:hypothetical protein